MNRAERRRADRAHARQAVIVRPPGHDGTAGFVGTGTGHVQRAEPTADLPPKEPGRHRWMVVAAWIVDETVAAEAMDRTKRHVMDNSTLLEIGVACYDCEQPLGDGRPGTITTSSTCPAPGAP